MEDLLQVGHEVDFIKGVYPVRCTWIDRTPISLVSRKYLQPNVFWLLLGSNLFFSWFKTQRFVGIGILCMKKPFVSSFLSTYGRLFWRRPSNRRRSSSSSGCGIWVSKELGVEMVVLLYRNEIWRMHLFQIWWLVMKKSAGESTKINRAWWSYCFSSFSRQDSRFTLGP